jgi:hypothetical protein
VRKLALVASAVLTLYALSLVVPAVAELPERFRQRLREPEDLSLVVVSVPILMTFALTGIANFVRILRPVHVARRTMHVLNLVSLLVVVLVSVLLLPTPGATIVEFVLVVVPLMTVVLGYYRAWRTVP